MKIDEHEKYVTKGFSGNVVMEDVEIPYSVTLMADGEIMVTIGSNVDEDGYTKIEELLTEHYLKSQPVNCGFCKVKDMLIKSRNKVIQELLGRICEADCEKCSYTDECDDLEA